MVDVLQEMEGETTVSSQTVGDDFEIEMREFLDSAGFKSIDGGRNFFFDKEQKRGQVDACGMYGDKLFIVECKAAKKLSTKKDFKSDINNFRYTIEIVRKTYKTHEKYKTCNEIIAVFATKKYKIRAADLGKLEENKIRYVDDEFLSFYSDMIKMIGGYSIYNLLADLEVPLDRSDQFKTLAIKQTIGNKTAYLFYSDPLDLLKVCCVARRGAGVLVRKDKFATRNPQFYQRFLAGSRLGKIRKYIKSKNSIFPNNVVLSVRESDFHKLSFYFDRGIKGRLTDYPEDQQVGILRTKFEFPSIWVIDGQHRLYSFANSDKIIPVPCILLTDIPITEERDMFVAINKEQKRVDSDLLWDIAGEADPDCKTEDSLHSNIVKMLNKQEKLFPETPNPFFNLIYIPINGPKKKGQIKISAFCDALKNSRITKESVRNADASNSWRHNPLFAAEDKTMQRNRTAKIISTYFKLLKERLNENQNILDYIFGNAGVALMLRVLEPIVMSFDKIPQDRDLSPFCNLITSYFMDMDEKEFRTLKKTSTSESARTEYAKNVIVHLSRNMPDFSPVIDESELEDDIKLSERKLGRLISKIMSSEYGANWYKTKAQQQYIKYKDEMQSKGQEFDEFLGLGDESSIIQSFWRDFEEYLSDKTVHGAFSSKNSFSEAINCISSIRGPVMHGSTLRTKIIPNEKFVLAKTYLKILDNCFEENDIAYPDSGSEDADD